MLTRNRDVGANVFSFVADVTSDPVRPWNSTVPLDQMFYNQSYDGVFNDAASNPVYPKPNVDLKTATGRTILPSIAKKWQNSTAPSYYTGGIAPADGMHPPVGYGNGGYAA